MRMRTISEEEFEMRIEHSIQCAKDKKALKKTIDDTRSEMFDILVRSADAADAALEDLRTIRDALEVKIKLAISRANFAHRKLDEFDK